MTMQQAGVVVTVNSDNAEMFGVDVADEFCRLRDAFDLDADSIVELCRAGLDAAWLDDTERQELRSRFDDSISRELRSGTDLPESAASGKAS